MQKISSYIGFAIKARKVVFGQSMVKHTSKQLHLVLVSDSASENLKDLAKLSASKHGCEMLEINDLENLTHKKDIKIIGLLDESLAKAIINNKE